MTKIYIIWIMPRKGKIISTVWYKIDKISTHTLTLTHTYTDTHTEEDVMYESRGNLEHPPHHYHIIIMIIIINRPPLPPHSQSVCKFHQTHLHLAPFSSLLSYAPLPFPPSRQEEVIDHHHHHHHHLSPSSKNQHQEHCLSPQRIHV